MNIMEIGKNPNYLGSYDLYDLNVNELTLTIKAFREEEVTTNGQKEKCAVMYFNEKYKPMIINPTNKKILARMFHTVMSEKLVGHRITVGIEKVRAFGQIHDALRIRNIMPPQTPEQEQAEQIICEVCGKPINATSSMTPKDLAAYTRGKYGKAMCYECATAAAKGVKSDESTFADH